MGRGGWLLLSALSLLLFFFSLLAVDYLWPQRIFIHYLRENNKAQLQIYLVLWRWKFRFTPAMSGTGRAGLDRERIKGIVRIGRPYRKKLIWKKFKLRIDLGLGDPALTGTAAGGGWALQGALLPFLFRHFRFLGPPEIRINPLFQEMGLKVDWEGELAGPIFFWLKLWSLLKRNRRFE